MKAITIRLTDETWKACVHRLVDDEQTFQHMLEPLLDEYAQGKHLGVVDVPAEKKKPTRKGR